jgi:hypothetical protein
MDMFAFHPYLIPSKLPPTFKNPRGTTVALSDYDKLVVLLDRAFRGTAQPGKGLPIVYDEFGYQSQIPAAKRSLYQNLGTTAARDAIPEKKQAQFYRQAFAIAQCQPTVAGIMIFHVADERDANRWQSGVYYHDNTPKSSLAAVRSAALRAQAGTLVQCAKGKTPAGVGAVVFHDPTAGDVPALGIDFSCTLICRYEARVVRVETGKVTLVAAGTGSVGAQTVSVDAAKLPPGTYQYSFRASAAGRPGTAVTRFSRPFTIADHELAPSDGDDLEPPSAPAVGHRTLPSLPTLPTLIATVPPRTTTVAAP